VSGQVKTDDIEQQTQMSEAYQQRFGGIGRLYGKTELGYLRASHVCVVGIGGVGSWAAEALARSGVGEITLIDLDDICVTNINRQIHATSSTVGQMKVDVMAERIRSINPECQVHAIDDFLTEETLEAYISERFDGVIDAIDSAHNKAKLIAWCRRKKIPIVTTGAAGGLCDPTKIQIVDLTRTQNDPLAAKVRSLLRRFYGFTKTPKKRFSVPCVFSMELMRYPKPDGSACVEKSAMDDGVRLDCSGGFGASTLVTATFALFAVSKIVEKVLSNHTKEDAGR
jgi:tRNA A37 threonylcarbamoyladenosine dehydratase